MIMKMREKISPMTIGLMQAAGLISYCVGVGWFIFTRAEETFGPMTATLGSTLFLMLFIVSGLICGLIAFAYPIKVFIKTKKLDVPLQIVGYTTLWLAVVTITIFVAVSL